MSGSLPDELLLMAFSRLNHRSLTSASGTNRRWRRIATSHSLWHKILQRRWPGVAAALASSQTNSRALFIKLSCPRTPSWERTVPADVMVLLEIFHRGTPVASCTQELGALVSANCSQEGAQQGEYRIARKCLCPDGAPESSTQFEELVAEIRAAEDPNPLARACHHDVIVNRALAAGKSVEDAWQEARNAPDKSTELSRNLTAAVTLIRKRDCKTVHTDLGYLGGSSSGQTTTYHWAERAAHPRNAKRSYQRRIALEAQDIWQARNPGKSSFENPQCPKVSELGLQVVIVDQPAVINDPITGTLKNRGYEAGDLALVFKAEVIDDFWENSAGEVCSGGGGSGSIEPDANVLSALEWA